MTDARQSYAAFLRLIIRVRVVIPRYEYAYSYVDDKRSFASVNRPLTSLL
jgi:hypothetical protein